MRSFLTASLILLVMIGLIVCNSFCVTRKIDRMTELCEKLERGDPVLNELLSEWHKCRDFLALSINHSEIDRAEDALCELLSYLESGSGSNFSAKLRDFRSALKHISDAQKLSLDNIL